MGVRATRRRIVAQGALRQAQGDGFEGARGAPRTTTIGFAWISGVTLFVVVCLSVYAVARPPEFPDPGNRPAFSAVARYSLADFFNGAR